MRLFHLPLNKQTNQKEQKVNTINRSWRNLQKGNLLGCRESCQPWLSQYRWLQVLPDGTCRIPAAGEGPFGGGGSLAECGPDDLVAELLAQTHNLGRGEPALPATLLHHTLQVDPVALGLPVPATSLPCLPCLLAPDSPQLFSLPRPQSHTFTPNRPKFLTPLLQMACPACDRGLGCLDDDTGMDQMKATSHHQPLSLHANMLDSWFLAPGVSPTAQSDLAPAFSPYTSAHVTLSLLLSPDGCAP